MSTLKSPAVSVIVHHQCVSTTKPDNIHARFVSHMRGILIYKVFRGARWAHRLISPWWEEEKVLLGYKGKAEQEAGYFYAPYVPLQSSGVVAGFFVGDVYYPADTNIHAVWGRELRAAARKWIPWYRESPGERFGFKTRYDK